MSDPAPDDVLRLRLRVEELEHELEQARRERAAVRAELDDLTRSKVWRATSKVRGLARHVRPDVVVAQAGGRVLPGVTRIPLAGLLAEADGEARWTDEIVVDEVALPGLLADPPSAVTWRIVPRGRLRFRAFAGVRTGEALGNVGGVRFVATVLDGHGQEVRRAERVIDPAGFPDQRRWLSVKLDLGGLPATEHRLVLTTELPDGASPEWAWAAWGDPVLLAGAPDLRALGSSMRVAAGHRTNGVAAPPSISLLVPVHDPDPVQLERTIASVMAQTAPGWQLCLSDDGSTDPEVRAILERAATDERVVLTRSEAAAGISAATNAALALAGGEFVAPLDHDDTLEPNALAAVGAKLAGNASVDVVYTDNDKELPGGARFAAALKPDWSPEYLRACMYTLHLGVYRRALVEQVGGFRSAFDGAQDHDLLLRLADAGARIAHVPETLHHWGVHPSSTAENADAKPEAFERGVAAVQDHLDRTGLPARAVRLPIAGRYRVVHDHDPSIAVDLLLPRDEGWSDVSAAFAADPRVRVTVLDPGGVWGERAGAAVAATEAPVVVLFEDLCVPQADDWLDELIGLVRTPGVGAAGAMVTGTDGNVVHAGVALPRGVPLPVHPGADPDAEDPAPELTMVMNRTAAAGVVAFDRAELLAAGGVRPLDRMALIATTLALSTRVVVSPHARLRLVGGPPRAAVLDPAELAVVARRGGDPLYNPKLWADRASHVVPRAMQRGGFGG